jgi:hypothetical protein
MAWNMWTGLNCIRIGSNGDNTEVDLRELEWNMWTGFNWLRIGSNGVPF